MLLAVADVAKTFTMHLRGGARLPVLRDVAFTIAAGECVALAGPSGAGKSSILKMIFGNYRCDRGSIVVRHGDSCHDVAAADARTMLALRDRTIAYVSQFLRAVPRVAAIDVVAEPLILRDVAPDKATVKAGDMLARLNLPERLWSLPPATFSGGEQQRVNIARGFIGEHPLLLLDEPTASLDALNSQRVIELINERKCGGTAMLTIVHDADVRDAIADRIVDVSAFAPSLQ